MTGIRIKGLVKRHGPITAVGGLDLDIASGELVVLLGPSGCGKTTTLRCVAGLEIATDGEIWIGDELVSSPRHDVPPERRSIGMVFQSYALWPHMTVAQNLSLGLRLQKVNRDSIRQRVADALDLVGMADFGARNAGELSGGQQQRVALARAVVLEPKILLFDEPLSNLDAKMRERMRVEIRQVQKRLGITALYVTHDQQEAMVIADRIVLMRAGQIVQTGSPRTVYHQPATHFAAQFIGSANILRGHVVENGDGLTLDCGAGSLRASGASLCAKGEAVDIVARPEDITLSRQADATRPQLLGQIVEVIFLGNMNEIEVTVGAQRLRIQTNSKEQWQPGETVWLSIDPANIVILNNTDREA